jgi:hypothetical protein
MEIRALTGFDKSTREQYGRSYTPLNGTNTLLGMGNVMTPQQIKERFNISVTPAGEVVDTFNTIDDLNKKFVPANQNPNNFFVRYKKPLLVAGGIVAAFLLYKKFK